MDQHVLQWCVIGIAVLMYAAVIVFPAKKAWITLIAAGIVVCTGAVTPLYALGTLINWNILMIYIGSLIIAELFIYSRVPARIADVIVSIAPNSGVAMVAILVMTGIISAFVENVATVLVMTPIALSLSKKLKMNPTSFLVGLAVMANLQGTATLVGDPPSMIFASYAGYTFNDFFFHNGKLSIFFMVQVGMLAGAVFFYLYFTRSNASRKKVDVEKTPVRSLFPTTLLFLMIVGLAASSFVATVVTAATENAAWTEYISGSWVMILAFAGIFWFRFWCKESTAETASMIKRLDWETIFFLCGIFIVIGAVTGTGILEKFATLLADFIGGNVLLGFVVILAVSVLISGFVDNVPYIIAMLPVAASLASNMGLPQELYLFALLIGSCLGGNLTPFGASANIVSIGILKKNGYPLSFGGWLKIGAPFTLLTTIAAAIALWLLIGY